MCVKNEKERIEHDPLQQRAFEPRHFVFPRPLIRPSQLPIRLREIPTVARVAIRMLLEHDGQLGRKVELLSEITVALRRLFG